MYNIYYNRAVIISNIMWCYIDDKLLILYLGHVAYL